MKKQEKKGMGILIFLVQLYLLGGCLARNGSSRSFENNSQKITGDEQLQGNIRPVVDYKINFLKLDKKEYKVVTLTGAKVKHGSFSLESTFGTQQYGLFLGMMADRAHYYFMVNGLRVDPNFNNYAWGFKKTNLASSGFLVNFPNIDSKKIEKFKTFISDKTDFVSPTCVVGTTKVLTSLVKINRDEKSLSKIDKLLASVAFKDIITKGFIDPISKENVESVLYRVNEKYDFDDFLADAHMREETLMEEFKNEFQLSESDQNNPGKNKIIAKLIEVLDILNGQDGKCAEN